MGGGRKGREAAVAVWRKWRTCGCCRTCWRLPRRVSCLLLVGKKFRCVSDRYSFVACLTDTSCWLALSLRFFLFFCPLSRAVKVLEEARVLSEELFRSEVILVDAFPASLRPTYVRTSCITCLCPSLSLQIALSLPLCLCLFSPSVPLVSPSGCIVPPFVPRFALSRAGEKARAVGGVRGGGADATHDVRIPRAPKHHRRRAAACSRDACRAGKALHRPGELCPESPSPLCVPLLSPL